MHDFSSFPPPPTRSATWHNSSLWASTRAFAERFEHRLLRRESPAVNLLVFPPQRIEVTRMLGFRDHLPVNFERRSRPRRSPLNTRVERTGDRAAPYDSAPIGQVRSQLRRPRRRYDARWLHEPLFPSI